MIIMGTVLATAASALGVDSSRGSGKNPSVTDMLRPPDRIELTVHQRYIVPNQSFIRDLPPEARRALVTGLTRLASFDAKDKLLTLSIFQNDVRADGAPGTTLWSLDIKKIKRGSTLKISITCRVPITSIDDVRDVVTRAEALLPPLKRGYVDTWVYTDGHGEELTYSVVTTHPYADDTTMHNQLYITDTHEGREQRILEAAATSLRDTIRYAKDLVKALKQDGVVVDDWVYA